MDMKTDDNATYRAAYRATEIGEHYSGRLHFWFTTLWCMTLIGTCIIFIHHPTWKELLIIPVGFLYINFGEYIGHRGPMHHRKQAFEKVMAIQPDNLKAFPVLLQIAQKNGASKADLVKMIKMQIEKAPKSAGLHIILGNLYLGDNQLQEALAAYNTAQSIDPNEPQPYTMSALILNKQGKTEQAIREYKELLAKQPKALDAHMGLGSLYEQSGKSDLAKEAYQKALQIKADFAPAANNLAYMIAESKDPDLGEALRLALIAKQQKPDDIHIIDTLGWVHYKRGAFGLARSEFVQAVEKEENMPILRYHLALALYGEGKKAEAIKELEKTLGQNQPFKEKDEAAATLQKWQSER